MPALWGGVVAVSCGVLLWSALDKLGNRSDLARTLAALTGHTTLANALAPAVPCLEFVAVLLIVFRAPSVVSATLLAFLGTTFALAGAWALRTHQVLPCACFGARHGQLGWRQIGALPLWLLAAAGTLTIESFAVRDRALALSAISVALCVVRAASAYRGWAGARGDRRALVGG